LSGALLPKHIMTEITDQNLNV